ncbi:MAG: TIGR02996 domain-containing protein, partial [Myxococcota bacterium]
MANPATRSSPGPEVRLDLERTLRANPDDRETWLAYGAWLTEHGDPRGRLIAIDEALAHPQLDHDVRRTLEDEARRLDPRTAPLGTYALSLANAQTIDTRISTWRSGFVLDVVARRPTALTWLVDHPVGRLLTGFSLRYKVIGPTGMKALCGAPLAALKRLDLSGNHLDDDAAQQLAASPHARNLVELDLSYNDIGPDGFAALLSSPHLAELRHLDLSHNPLTEALVESLLRSPPGVRLRVLRLTGTGLGEDGAILLGEVPGLGGLQELDLGQNHLG